jgi:hypothetical protein
MFVHLGRRLLGLPLGQFQLLVFDEQIIDRFPQKNRFWNSGLIGKLIEQSGLRRLKIERLQLLDAFGFRSHRRTMQ